MNPKALEQLYALLIAEDELLVLELLDITAEDLVTAFIHKVKVRHDYITSYYEDTTTASDETSRREEERFGPRGLGSLSVWEDAGFEIEKGDL